MFVFRRGSGCISVIAIIVLLLTTVTLLAHDKNHPVNSSMKSWFDSLTSGKGPCCSDADGSALSDVDWETKGGHYRVRINGNWIDVPDDAVLKQPNLYGKTMVWPISTLGYITIRCFIPGVLM